jgi:hypothetical protein
MYLQIMMRLRQEAEEEAEMRRRNPQPANACEFSSSQQFKESMMRHKRMKNGVQTKQLAPLTASQEVRFLWLFKRLVLSSVVSHILPSHFHLFTYVPYNNFIKCHSCSMDGKNKN